MSRELHFLREEREAELADVQALDVMVALYDDHGGSILTVGKGE